MAALSPRSASSSLEIHCANDAIAQSTETANVATAHSEHLTSKEFESHSENKHAEKLLKDKPSKRLLATNSPFLAETHSLMKTFAKLNRNSIKPFI